MQGYDVQEHRLYLIESQSGYNYNIALMPGESITGLGGVIVSAVGRRVIITSAAPTMDSWRYNIDYDAYGDVIYPGIPSEIEEMIRDLTEIGCYEYTPDLLRAIQIWKDTHDGYQRLISEADKTTYKIRL